MWTSPVKHLIIWLTSHPTNSTPWYPCAGEGIGKKIYILCFNLGISDMLVSCKVEIRLMPHGSSQPSATVPLSRAFESFVIDPARSCAAFQQPAIFGMPYPARLCNLPCPGVFMSYLVIFQQAALVTPRKSEGIQRYQCFFVRLSLGYD